MKIKEGVSLVGLHIKMRKVISVVEYLWNIYNKEAVITAGSEVVDDDLNFIHSVRSLHPFGLALDFRTRYFNKYQKKEIKTKLALLLGNNYDVILHSTHIHVEYDEEKTTTK